MYAGANDEFLRAHEHYRHKRHKECLNECLKAFESMMKAICKKRRWPYSELIQQRHCSIFVLRTDSLHHFGNLILQVFGPRLKVVFRPSETKLLAMGKGQSQQSFRHLLPVTFCILQRQHCFSWLKLKATWIEITQICTCHSRISAILILPERRVCGCSLRLRKNSQQYNLTFNLRCRLQRGSLGNGASVPPSRVPKFPQFNTVILCSPWKRP